MVMLQICHLTFILTPIIKQIIVIIVQKEQYKEWKCIYEQHPFLSRMNQQSWEGLTIADNLYIKSLKH